MCVSFSWASCDVRVCTEKNRKLPYKRRFILLLPLLLLHSSFFMSTRLVEMKRAKSGDFHSTLITMPAGAVHVTYGCKHNICILIFYCWRCWLPLLVSFFHISFSSYSYIWCWFRSWCGRKTRYAFLLPAYSWFDGKTGRCHRQRRRRCRRLRGCCIKFTSFLFLSKKKEFHCSGCLSLGIVVQLMFYIHYV